MDRFDPFVKYADVYGDIINWEKDPMNKPQNQNKYFFSDGKTYYEQICKMLRLMSVFKEAFNQIYSNEDEISEAWENFVNNLSASVVEGSEPDVTLTWTDDSVNFEFTMVPGVQGDPGVGITSISFNSDYTMTITLSDGNTYTSMSLKGETGPQGPQGETGSGLQILDVYATLADLQSAHPTGQPGDAYQVGSAGNYILYIWSSSQSAWVQAGTLGTVSPYTSAPLMDGTASAGSQNLYARGDHVHPSDTSRASKEELDALIRTSQALIDQSFTYRESPAIQDGLARIDKIKGNTLVWNQIAENGNFDSVAGWGGNNSSITVANNVLTGTVTTSHATAGLRKLGGISFIANHKYLVSAVMSCSVASDYCVARFYSTGYDLRTDALTIRANTKKRQVWILTPTSSFTGDAYIYPKYSYPEPLAVGDTFTFEDVMLIDLSKMFGIGNEPTTVDEFTSLFPLPYYDYNAGSLLNFNGTGLKTTGKNLVFKILPSANLGSDGIIVNDLQNIYDLAVAEVVAGKQYYIGNNRGNNALIGWFTEEPQIGSTSYNGQRIVGSSLIPIAPITGYIVFRIDKSFAKPTFNLGTGSIDYEPYTQSNLSLPVSQYFPNGMRSAGNAHDELAPEKAITRIGAVDLGTLTWNRNASAGFFVAKVQGMKPASSVTERQDGILCSKYPISTIAQINENMDDKSMLRNTNNSEIIIRDTSYTDTTTFKTAMNGVYLYYELATPTETAVDLDLAFNAYEDGTEQLLPVNGSVPSTSPIIADMTYLSIDDAMEYIIDKLANVPQNTQQILESLEDDVADLQTDVGALQPAVSALQTSVGNINTNIGQISSTVAGHTSSISDMQSDITDLNTGLSDLEDTVTANTARIGTLENRLSTTNENVQNLETSVSDLDDTVTAQGTTVTALDDIISDISNTPVSNALGNHELGFVVAYVEATLPANTGTMVTIPKPTIFPNNYTPLFIVGMSTGSYNVSICSIPNTFGTSNSVTCRVWNHGSQQTTQISIYILCMRQKQSQ